MLSAAPFSFDWLPVDPGKFALYLGVMAVMAITPGPANIFAISTGVARGPRSALISVAGMNTATFVWFCGAAVGLSALVTAFPDQFHWIAIAGAAYLAYLGAKALISAWAGGALALHGRPAGQAAFRDGFAVQFSNPKVVLFFTAVLPPFLDPARPAGPQMLLFALVTLTLDGLAMTGYGLAGGMLSAWLSAPGPRRAFAALAGILLLSAAAMVLIAH